MCIFCVLRPQPRCSWTSNRRKQYLRTMNGINDVNGPNGQQHYKPLEAQSIAQRQQEVWNVCRALKDRNELYGVLTRIAIAELRDRNVGCARSVDGFGADGRWCSRGSCRGTDRAKPPKRYSGSGRACMERAVRRTYLSYARRHRRACSRADMGFNGGNVER